MTTWFHLVSCNVNKIWENWKLLHVQRHDRQHKVRTMWGLWWANLRQVRPVIINVVSDNNISVVVSQTISNQLNQVCDAPVRQLLARGLSLLFTGLTYLPLSSFWWFFYSSSFAKVYSRPRTCHFGCYRYSHFMTFWTSVWKSQRHVLTFSLWCPHILEIFWKSHDNVLHISVKCQVWDISWQS